MREEILEAFKHLKIAMAPGPSEVYAQMILASGDILIKMLMDLFQRILDGIGMPEDWATSVAIPIFEGNGDVMNCGMYWGVNLVEHAMKIVNM